MDQKFKEIIDQTDLTQDMKDLIYSITEMGRAVESDFEYTKFIMVAHIKLEKIMRKRIINRLTLNLCSINEQKLKDREALSGYKEVCAMAYSIGILSKNLYSWLKKFNQVRNDIAHKDEYELDSKKLKELKSVFPQLYIAVNAISPKTFDEIEELKAVLSGIHIFLQSGMMDFRTPPEKFYIEHKESEGISDDHPICCGSGEGYEYYKGVSKAENREQILFEACAN